MADIVHFPPTTPPEKPASPEILELREKWRGIEHAVQGIRSILGAVSSADELTPDQRFRMQWEFEYLIDAGRVDAIQRQRLPAEEYRRRRERLMRSMGLGHLL